MLVFLWRNLHIKGAQVLFKVPDCSCTRNRKEVWALSHDPGQINLGGGAAFLGGQVLEDLYEI